MLRTLVFAGLLATMIGGSAMAHPYGWGHHHCRHYHHHHCSRW
ncbi:MAG TPA: hypothetical protein VGI95_11810 [Caulobacteraceae bacterium]|jgi:hypothetical protein